MKTTMTQTARKQYVQPQTRVFPVKMHAILCESGGREDYEYVNRDEQ